MENGIIYRITSPSGKKRIGYTRQSFKRRMCQYGYLALPSNKRKHPLTQAIRKYGWGAFKKEIIIEGITNFDLLCELEKHYIRLEATTFRDKGYNLESGGVTGTRNLPKEVSERMSKIQKERHKKNFKDISGTRYAKLLAIKYIGKERGSIYLWQCDCGNQKEILLSSVKNGDTTSCGCVFRSCKRNKHIDVSGSKFNRLLAKKLINWIDGKPNYLWECDCGETKELPLPKVKFGATKSCGCLKKERVGELHQKTRIILNKETGLFYFTLQEAADSIGIVRTTLNGYLCNRKPNKTQFIYV